MWRVSDDFSGTRISYGYKLWLIAWMLLTDWTSRLEYCLQSPKQRQLHTPPPQKSIIRNYENNIKE